MTQEWCNHEFFCLPYFLSIYGDPFSSFQDGTCNDSIYLRYEEGDSSSSYKDNRGMDQEHGGLEMVPYGNSGLWVEDCASDFGTCWGGSESYCRLEALDNRRDKYWRYDDYVHPGGCDGFFIGGNFWDNMFCNLEDTHGSRSWNDWELEETTLYERIYGR